MTTIPARVMNKIATAHRLKRETFKTSRLLDFCSERELTKQVGHGVEQWPLVILKELVDNALDAAEEFGIAPVIGVEVADGAIIITDNGPGIPAETVAGMLDFLVRVSSREAYVSPTRGAQGNALKTIIAMAFALDGTTGETVIESQGITHKIIFRVDHVRNEPRIDHVCTGSDVKTGTRVTVHWPGCASSKLDEARPRFLQMADDFVWLNPHLSLSLDWKDANHFALKASDPAWTKWQPQDPISAHWYDPPRLRRLIGAYIARDEDTGRDPRTVREFISEFRGLSGTGKQKLILDQIGGARMSLPDLFGSGDDVNMAAISKLLEAMKRQSRPVKSKDLASSAAIISLPNSALPGPISGRSNTSTTSARMTFRMLSRPHLRGVQTVNIGASSPGSTGRPQSAIRFGRWATLAKASTIFWPHSGQVRTNRST